VQGAGCNLAGARHGARHGARLVTYCDWLEARLEARPGPAWYTPSWHPAWSPAWSPAQSHTVTGWRPGWRPGRGPAWSLALHHGELRVNSAFEKRTEMELMLVLFPCCDLIL